MRIRASVRAIAITGVTLLLIIPASAARADGPVSGPSPGGDRSLALSQEQLHGVPGLTPEVLAKMNVQDGLLRLVDRIRAAAPTAAAGLGGTVVDPDHNALRLYWHGAMPSTVSRIVTDARAGGVTISLGAALYTERRLLAEIDRMVKVNATAADGSRYDLQLAPKPDGSGIWVGLAGLAPSAVARTREVAPALVSAVPLQVEATGRFAFTHRWYDQSPFWGGAYIERAGAGITYMCSNAFGVTGNNGAATYLLTAAHCGEGTWKSGPVQDPATGSTFQRTYGNTIPAGRDTQHDAQLILASAPAGNAIYWGASINPPSSLGSNSGVTVGGTENNVVGAYVCNSGSFSGTICNIQIQLAKVSFSFSQPENGVQHMNNMSLGVKQLDSSNVVAAVGQGDSGGPMVSIVSQRARAWGVISGMYTDSQWLARCVGYTPPGRVCSRSVWFGDIRTILNTVGARMNTG